MRVRGLLLARGAVIHVGQLLRTELVSAVVRRVREGSITAHEGDSAIRTFRAHERSRYHVIALSDSVHDLAEQLLRRRTLRAADALHLASALSVGRALARAGAPFQFVTADRMQADAADAEGLSLLYVGRPDPA